MTNAWCFDHQNRATEGWGMVMEDQWDMNMSSNFWVCPWKNRDIADRSSIIHLYIYILCLYIYIIILCTIQYKSEWRIFTHHDQSKCTKCTWTFNVLETSSPRPFAVEHRCPWETWLGNPQLSVGFSGKTIDLHRGLSTDVLLIFYWFSTAIFDYQRVLIIKCLRLSN